MGGSYWPQVSDKESLPSDGLEEPLATVGRRYRALVTDEPYPDALQLLGCYLHQDFDLDDGTADAAIEHAVTESDADRLSGAARELAEIADLDDRSIETILNRLCSYHPPSDGRTYREWLLSVIARCHQSRRCRSSAPKPVF